MGLMERQNKTVGQVGRVGLVGRVKKNEGNK